MYKDKERQREADRARQRRYRAKAKGVTGKGVTVTPCVTSETLTPDGFVPVAVQLGYAKGERGYKVPLPGDKGSGISSLEASLFSFLLMESTFSSSFAASFRALSFEPSVYWSKKIISFSGLFRIIL